jgi:hypothetical protein
MLTVDMSDVIGLLYALGVVVAILAPFVHR